MLKNFVMMNKTFHLLLLFCLPLFLYGCNDKGISSVNSDTAEIIVGAERTDVYFPWLEEKSIAIIANQSSMIRQTHLLHTLLNAGFNVKKIFCPEHGFRGDSEAGESFGNDIDQKTGIPVISLYGKNYKPRNSDLNDIDILIFDIQDVGARFYTYISTMTYAMEACAENDITLLVLDRPNPNGFYVDGPVLEKDFSSFVGLHQVPVVHGMTVAEYANMVNGEGWLENKEKCSLKFVKLENYDHNKLYTLPVKPSPNLPNMTSIYLYPSLCLFEGTVISIGRGTTKPFQVIGHPEIKETPFYFVPESIPGVSLNPKFKGQQCFGYDLSDYSIESHKDSMQLDLSWLIRIYEQLDEKDEFFNSYFNKLAGNSNLQEQIKQGVSGEKIRKSWQEDLERFKQIRKKYLLYEDF